MENIEKKTYETPEAEKMMFNYRDQVVVASNCHMVSTYQSSQTTTCVGDQVYYK